MAPSIVLFVAARKGHGKGRSKPAEAKVNAQGVRLAKASERLECFGGGSPIKSDDTTLAPVAFLLRKHNFSRRHWHATRHGAEKTAKGYV